MGFIFYRNSISWCHVFTKYTCASQMSFDEIVVAGCKTKMSKWQLSRQPVPKLAGVRMTFLFQCMTAQLSWISPTSVPVLLWCPAAKMFKRFVFPHWRKRADMRMVEYKCIGALFKNLLKTSCWCFSLYCIFHHGNKILFYSIHSILFYSILFYSILFYSILFYAIQSKESKSRTIE